ncbi:glycine betaine/proline transport system permease protein [Duganella sp. CF517]|uniref:ABC transporter permease n=1 Tax=Duganella sp. CF517 TaxID=1881038 RepID=UPI0008D4E214|nr:proline/glycine betaine ABC transporter permease [Duganella sp. CF517]SEO65116.1 glycine betaine/proline transport system permease protein [Duganella sp. CF517]
MFEQLHQYFPLGDAVNGAVRLLIDHNGGLFDSAGRVIEGLAAVIESALQLAPAWVVIGIATVVGWRRLSWRFAVFAGLSLLLIAVLGYWPQMIVTLGLTLSATVISLALGVPLGILAARNRHVHAVLRPVLDFMQTMPAFVYLIPAVMLFGLGRVPGIIATVIFAMPPAVRLTTIGILQVDKEQLEAGQAFGASGWQLLFKVQLPLALPALMGGINQTIMMALSMVIVTSMVGAGGLGGEVLSSIQQLDVGLGFESGLCVVLLAIILDRITQSFGER